MERLTHYQMLPRMGPPDTKAWEFPGGDGSWEAETADFVEEIRLGRTRLSNLQDAIKTLEIVETIYRKSGYPTT
jgi:predicted dehydrogenase